MSDDKKILIVDPDLSFYERFNDDPDKGKVKFEFFDSGAKAQAAIKENRGSYAAVLVSPELRNPDGYSVMKGVMMFQPTVPIYFIESFRTELNEGLDERKIPIAGTFAKPFNIGQIIKKLGASLRIFDLQSALEVAKKNSDGLNEELEDTDPNFRPIQAELFISGSQSLFDVYVKLRKDKYIKILQGGDNFDYERVMEYLKKGVSHFHIRKEALEAYVNYCDKLTNAIASNQQIALDKKFGFVFNQAEVTLNTMVDLGVDSDSIAYAQKYLKNVCNMIDLYGKKSDFLSGVLKELGKFEHSGGVVMVSSIVARAAGVETEKGLQTLGLAAFLHDLGMIYRNENEEDLYNDGKEKYYDESFVVEKLASKKIYGDEKTLFESLWFNHADRGARMLEQEKDLPPLVAQIVRQHHSQRDKREGRARPGTVHPMAEILEISDEFVRLMKKFEEEGENNRDILISRLLQVISDFPRRTREPFLESFGFTKKAA
jgi:hypothetical protein